MYKILIIILTYFSSLNGEGFKINPIMKSAFMPGWGESSLGNYKRSRLFYNIEISLWTLCIGSYTYSYHSKMEYESFAVKHANVNANGKDDKYWVDIGNYIDIENHNAEHLRWRSFDELYNEKDGWEWDSETNMKRFEKMRIKSDFFSKNGEYIIGTIILNHILSTIDTLYLLNLKKNQNITLIPVISKYYSKINLTINF